MQNVVTLMSVRQFFWSRLKNGRDKRMRAPAVLPVVMGSSAKDRASGYDCTSTEGGSEIFSAQMIKVSLYCKC